MAETGTDTKTPRVFVSHHSSKASVAAQVEVLLAKRDVRCWIAPRDVPPGTPFDSAIQDAINECAAVLLLFCANSDKSRHVKRELILGDSAGRPIIPLRLEAIDPGELAYHLADSQWIDWVDGREAVMDRVAAQVRLFAGAPAELARDVETLGAEPPEPVAPPPAKEEEQRKWLVPLLGGALLLALASAAYFAMSGGGSSEGTAEAVIAVDETATENAAETGGTPDAVADPEPSDPESSDPAPSDPSPPIARPTGLVAVPVSPTPTPTPTARPTFVAVPVTVATQAPLVRVVDACRGAASDTEYVICANPDVDALARQVGTLYRSLRDSHSSGSDEARAVQTEQRNWYNGVKASCNSKDCVEARYNARIAELRGMQR